MRISMLQSNLKSALSTTNGIATGKYSLPVLFNVLIATEDGRVKFTVTDLELSVSVWVGGKIEQEGLFTVPHKNLFELAKNLSPERADLEVDTRAQKLHLQCGGTTVKLPGITADEFPAIRRVENGVAVNISGGMLRDMVGEVEKVAATEDNRPVLMGVYTHIEGNSITMASADGYRLAVCKNVLDDETLEPLTAIIPKRALIAVAKMVGKGKKTIDFLTMRFDVHRNYMEFDLGDIVVTSNLIEGTFPMYERIVPKRSETKTIVYADDFLLACKKAKVFAKDSANTTRLSILPSYDGGVGTMTASAKSSEMGEIDSMIDAGVEGVAINAAYNVEYLIDAINAMGEDQVMLETIDYTEPLVIRGVAQGEKLYHVIMPMNVGQ